MGYEVDFIHVGDNSRSGDAIAFRYGNLHGPRSGQTVGVIDGGTKESGEKLVSHIANYYGTDRVNFVFSTHPDSDHASGLTVILEQLKVDALLMHLPWNHAADIRHMLEKAYSTGRLENALVRALSNVDELESLAKKKGIPIYEPFSDSVTFNDGALRILGPTKEYYQSLLPDFRETPEAKDKGPSPIAKAMTAIGETFARVSEAFGKETLDDTGETSAENNSSVILHLAHEGRSALFTGDAGIPALTKAADLADSIGLNLSSLDFLDVPHHGSRRNVGPTILNRIKAQSAFISVCKKGAPKHPSQRVVNALTRRGNKVYKTDGQNIWHHQDAPARPAYSALTPMPLVEEFDE